MTISTTLLKIARIFGPVGTAKPQVPKPMGREEIRATFMNVGNRPTFGIPLLNGPKPTAQQPPLNFKSLLSLSNAVDQSHIHRSHRSQEQINDTYHPRRSEWHPLKLHGVTAMKSAEPVARGEDVQDTLATPAAKSDVHLVAETAEESRVALKPALPPKPPGLHEMRMHPGVESISATNLTETDEVSDSDSEYGYDSEDGYDSDWECEGQPTPEEMVELLALDVQHQCELDALDKQWPSFVKRDESPRPGVEQVRKALQLDLQHLEDELVADPTSPQVQSPHSTLTRAIQRFDVVTGVPAQASSSKQSLHAELMDVFRARAGVSVRAPESKMSIPTGDIIAAEVDQTAPDWLSQALAQALRDREAANGIRNVMEPHDARDNEGLPDEGISLEFDAAVPCPPASPHDILMQAIREKAFKLRTPSADETPSTLTSAGIFKSLMHNVIETTKDSGTDSGQGTPEASDTEDFQ